MSQHTYKKAYLREIILGGQDGLVNVLGVVLAVAAATGNQRIIIISGLAATFAESVSMGAVAYTSSRAARAEFEKEKNIVMLRAEGSPLINAATVLIAALVGSFVPLTPFFFFNIVTSIYAAFAFSGVMLFMAGVYEARTTGGNIWREGFELLTIGLVAAVTGYGIGALLGSIVP